jgi:hypothetical protein
MTTQAALLAMPYYIRFRGQQQGPFTAEQLQKLAARGRFSPLYEVSTDGATWQRAEAFQELFPAPVQRKPEAAAAMAPVAAEAEAPVVPEIADEWYYTHSGAEHGPVTGAELKRLVGLGQVAADDHVWTEGMDYWQRVRDVPELARQLLPAATQTVAAPGGATPLSGPPLSAMSIASLVLGLAGATLLPLVGSILAVVFGHVALAQIRRAEGKLAGRGMALAGLILGYAVLIPAVIVAIVYVAIVALAPTGRRADAGDLLLLAGLN